jgi:hypothetical protein
MPQIEMAIDFSKTRDLPKGALKFFRTFSRMEFALKTCGCLPQTGNASADWSAFAKRLDKAQNFFTEIRNSGKADTLLTEPARKQVSQSGILSFERGVQPRNTQQLLEGICRVRNNLFHGGKYGDPDYSNRVRNERLVAEAQWVLEKALKRDDEVRWAFEDRH